MPKQITASTLIITNNDKKGWKVYEDEAPIEEKREQNGSEVRLRVKRIN